jgi:outer membrane murein-binding lipoprotein Lpp
MLCALAAGYELSAGVTPVQKVLAMMQEMKQKGVAEKEHEAKLFEEYQTWCKDTGVTKKQEIQTGAGQIERLTAEIQLHEAAAVELTDKVAALDADIAGWKADHQAVTEIRDKEHADYETTYADYSESIDAIQRAIGVLSSSSLQKVAQAMMFVQTVQKGKVPKRAEKILAAFIQYAQNPANPQAYAYESKSGGVVDMLENLKEQFLAERNDLEKEEMNNRHAYDMEALTLTDSIKYAERERAEKASTLSDHKASAAEAKGTLEQVSAEKAEDEKYLSDLESQCRLKAEAFANRQQMREEEIAAIAQAIEIIESKVSGLADKHLPALAQKKVALSLRRSAVHSPLQARAAKLLQERGSKLGSKELVLLATKVSADPFAKVIDMIKGLIAKLQEEAAAEADHKAWCDGELKENKLTREAKTEEVNQLTAKVDELNAQVAKLTEGIQAHEKAMGEIDAAMSEATTVRQKEKAKNEETIADCEAAIAAVESALQILREFYKKAGGGNALVQQTPADDAPASFSNDAYTGQQGSKRGVVDMIEVIHSDFSRLLSDTTSDEQESAREFDTFMEESAKDRELKRLDQLRMSRERTAINGPYGSLGSAEKDLKATQGELDAALDYYDKLKPDCIQEGLSFADRAQRRQEEIDSLNEAYKIISGDLSEA